MATRTHLRRRRIDGRGAYASVLAWFVAMALLIYFWKGIPAVLACPLSLALALTSPDLPNLKKMFSIGRASEDL